MDGQLLRDINERDIKNWSKSIDLCSEKIEIKSKRPNPFKSGALKGKLPLWLVSTVQVYSCKKPSVKLLFSGNLEVSFSYPFIRKSFTELGDGGIILNVIGSVRRLNLLKVLNILQRKIFRFFGRTEE